jgi:hypothetical protein
MRKVWGVVPHPASGHPLPEGEGIPGGRVGWCIRGALSLTRPSATLSQGRGDSIKACNSASTAGCRRLPRCLLASLALGWGGSGLDRANPDRLDVDELPDAEVGQLAAVAAVLDAAER